jgi:hypothetical protein
MDKNDHPISEPLLLTPDHAKQLVDDQKVNRNENQQYVDAYAQDMSEGKWQDNGEPITLDKEGRMIGGRHRCLAVIKSGVSVWVTVTRGVDESAFHTIGTGRVKTFAQDLEAFDANHDKRIASILAKVVRHLYTLESKPPYLNNSSAYISQAKLREVWTSHPGLRETVTTIMEMPNYKDSRSKLRPPLMVLGLYLFAKADPVKALEFVTRIYQGGGDPTDVPVKFRDRVSFAKRVSNRQFFVGLVKSWNVFYKGGKVEKLVLSSSKIPAIEGLPKRIENSPSIADSPEPPLSATAA